MRLIRVTLLLLPTVPVPAMACGGCRPAVLALGLSVEHRLDVALMFAPLGIALAVVFLFPWEKLRWMPRRAR